MKNKKMFLIIAAVTIVVFLFIIDTIKGIQRNIEHNKNSTDTEKFVEKYGSNEIFSFDEIVSKADFGKFVSMEFGFHAITDKSLFYNTIFEKGDYYYKNDGLINQIIGILKEFNYTYSRYSLSDDEETENIWQCRFQGYNGVKLCLNACSTLDENMIWLYVYTTDNLNLSINASEWFSKHSLGMLVSSEVSEKIMKVLQENTNQISLTETKKIIEENVDEMPLYKMLCYENKLYKHYLDYSNDDDYFIYKQQLRDSTDYLLVSLMNTVEPDFNDCNIYIFKIELYQEDGIMKEVLFDDTQRYEGDKDPENEKGK